VGATDCCARAVRKKTRPRTARLAQRLARAPGPRGLLQTIARRWVATIAAAEAEAERIVMGRMICTRCRVIGVDTPGLGPHATQPGALRRGFAPRLIPPGVRKAPRHEIAGGTLGRPCRWLSYGTRQINFRIPESSTLPGKYWLTIYATCCDILTLAARCSPR
jgi:hypothetical protein